MHTQQPCVLTIQHIAAHRRYADFVTNRSFINIKHYIVMVYGYIRVSSDKQTVENQRFDINKFCKRENLKVDDWIEETISGTKSYDKREFSTLLAKFDKDDIIICSELSQLGRKLFMIMEILNTCMNKGYRFWTIKDNYRLGDDIQSKVLAFASLVICTF